MFQRARRPNAPSRPNGEASGKGLDPSEFEPEFVIDDSDVPSRSGTPRPAVSRSESSTKDTTREPSDETRNGEDQSEKALPDGPSKVAQELPTDVKVKLRKLEKLESRYHDLLSSYRLAHARVQTIDSFEASLRENTPLTSISDPRALVEYLNQLNLKGDMVVDELKRVTHDRDTCKNQLDAAEQRAREAWDEVTNLRKAKDTGDLDQGQLISGTTTSSTNSSPVEASKVEQPSPSTTKSPISPVKSRTGSLPSLSIFSPKTKPLESPLANEVREDLFSYDDEIPRLQAEVKDRDTKIEVLQGEVTSLKGDLAVTRESTQSMVQALEEATRELNGLRDHKDRSTAEIKEHRQASKKLSDTLQAELKAAEVKLQEVEAAAKPEDTTRLAEVLVELGQAKKELETLREGASRSDGQASEVQALQTRVASLEKDISEARAARDQNEKKIDTLNSLLKNVRDQLAEEEHNHAQLLNNTKDSDETLRKRISQLEAELGNQQHSQHAKLETGDKGVDSAPGRQATDEKPGGFVDAPASGKKKNKKKKKTAKSVGEEAGRYQPSHSELAINGSSQTNQAILEASEDVIVLRDEIAKLREELEEKDAALEKIRSKMKDQDELKTEIEDLKYDLQNHGEEHVAAQARAKELQAEKQAIQRTVEGLERQIGEMQGSHEHSNASADEKHQNLTAQFEELKGKATALQTDLSAAQQLASSRFKELSELKTVMQKAQPELTSLRNEVGELRAIREAHDQKEVDLKRLETRQEEMRTEIATHRRVVTEHDAEIRKISQKLDQESSAKSRAEDARDKAHQEIQRLEMEKRQATESLDQLSKDLGKARDEITDSKGRLKDLEQQILRLRRDNEDLKEEIELKTAQYASAQSLMSSMRDQTAELAVQMKEARDRCESLDEEVADAHRLLSERSREGETMRRLLADVEGKADARTREMKERMETAIEERDRAEDEASTAARRRARELDDLRNKVREAERNSKRAEEDKEELEAAQREWKRRREELEQRSEQSTRETEDVRRAMGELRDALDESERQAREAEKQKVELRRSVEETQHRLQKLQKSNKSMADEIRTIQSVKNRAVDSEAHSSRSSTDSAPSRISRLASPVSASRQTGPGTANGQAPGSMDFVYLKNVLLQFLEQKDKNHQKQLIPVLGMFLHFDR
ncbi:MAG: hypothetical protein Q9181_004877 [Wetmoreana brouardii]